MLHINNEKFKSWHHKKRTATTVKRRARKTVKRQLIWIFTPLKIYPLQLILVTGYLVRQENLNSLKKLNKKANDARTHWALLPVYRKGIIHTINSRPNQSNRVIHSEKYESPSLQEEFRQTKSEIFLKVHFNSLFLLFLLSLVGFQDTNENQNTLSASSTMFVKHSITKVVIEIEKRSLLSQAIKIQVKFCCVYLWLPYKNN